MEQELISIVVPVYRAERYIEETMDCVRAQTYPHWELRWWRIAARIAAGRS